jgi:hypothetical protein
MSSLLSYHIFSFFISNIFENFKFGRNFSKFTAGMGCRLVAVSVKIGGNRRLPIGKENTGVRSHGDRRRLGVVDEEGGDAVEERVTVVEGVTVIGDTGHQQIVADAIC